MLENLPSESLRDCLQCATRRVKRDTNLGNSPMISMACSIPQQFFIKAIVLVLGRHIYWIAQMLRVTRHTS